MMSEWEVGPCKKEKKKSIGGDYDDTRSRWEKVKRERKKRDCAKEKDFLSNFFLGIRMGGFYIDTASK